MSIPPVLRYNTSWPINALNASVKDVHTGLAGAAVAAVAENRPHVLNNIATLSSILAHINLSTTVFTPSAMENVTSYINVTSSPVEVCSSPAFHEFPPDAFTSDQRSHGAIVIHLLVVMYMFVALALVCDEYFVASLDKLSEKLGLSEDVAGATFMAAGSSFPELCTAMIGVFITQGDVGVGTIVGSAVFNILFVIGLCGVLVKEVITLSWWPLCRDSIYYCLAVVVLILVVEDGRVTWYESLIMLLIYGGYIVIMRFNRSIQAIVTEKVKWLATEKFSSNGIMGKHLAKFQGDYEAFGENDDVFHVDDAIATERNEMTDITTTEVIMADEYALKKPMKLTFEEACFRIMMCRLFKGRTRFIAAVKLAICYGRRLRGDNAYHKRQQFKNTQQRSSFRSYTKSVRNWMSMSLEGENFDAWRGLPAIENGYLNMVRWAIVYPLRTLLYFTIPDCRKPKWEKFFLATFAVSILWIGLFSYIMVWMVTLIGYAFGIPDSVMGITFLAAGTSIPDAMASVFVAKQGMGDMAVSNCIGSNIFDILLGLSFPWFLKTAIAQPGTSVQINSAGMLYNIILLFLTVIIAVGSIHCAGWHLNRFVGFVCLLVYAIYVTFAVMIECNVFGFVNPPMCKE